MTRAPAAHPDRRTRRAATPDHDEPEVHETCDTPRKHSAPRWRSAHWFGLELGFPAEWSCAKHSCNPDHGGLVFVDRTRPRLQLAWTRTDTRPDFELLLEDYRQRTLGACAELADEPGDRSADAAVDPPNEHAGWRYVSRRDNGEPTLTRLVRYDETDTRLLELTLVHDKTKPGDTNGSPAGDEPLSALSLTNGIARRARIACPVSEATRWRLLGLDVTTPPGCRPTRIDARPADVAIRFDVPHRRRNATAIVRRRGLTAAWFDGDLDAWLRREHPDRRAHVSGTEHLCFRRRATGRDRQARAQRWVGRGRTVQLFATFIPEHKHVISLRIDHPTRDPFDAHALRVALDPLS